MILKKSLRIKGFIISILIYCWSTASVFSQDSILNKYGLWVIKDKRSLIESIKSNPDKQMLDINKNIPGIVLDLKYAGRSNFMHQKLYTHISTTFIRKPAAIALLQVQKELNQQGLSLKIFDAYRPYSITEKMWEQVKDDRYAADPKKGSGHNRGVAVDLTIIELKTGKELSMGTVFDNFSDTAHHDFKVLPDEILKNRTVLKSMMEKYGFKSLVTEWWHYSLPNAKDFELLDLSFKDLRKLSRVK
jgi:D-alanyl-D-alanine dipeptidase